MKQHESSCASIEPLISGALDNELTQQQRQQLHLHLGQCERCAHLYRELAEQRGAVKLGVRPTEAVGESKSVRWWNIVGGALVVLGVLPLVFFVVMEFAQDNAVPWWVKLTVGITFLGLALLFLNVLRQRFSAAKTDPYKKVNL